MTERSTTSDPVSDAAAAITASLADAGKVIEGGWMAFAAVVLSGGASPAQVSDMRMAFFAGAQHLFASVLSMLDEGQEPTDRDERRMTGIHEELAAFVTSLQSQDSK